MFHIFIEIRYFYQLIKIDPDVINGIVEKINQNVKENGGVSFSGNNPFHFCFDDTKIGGKFACVLTLSYVKELFEEYSGRIGEYTVLCFFSTESNEVVREELENKVLQIKDDKGFFCDYPAVERLGDLVNFEPGGNKILNFYFDGILKKETVLWESGNLYLIGGKGHWAYRAFREMLRNYDMEELGNCLNNEDRKVFMELYPVSRFFDSYRYEGDWNTRNLMALEKYYTLACYALSEKSKKEKTPLILNVYNQAELDKESAVLLKKIENDPRIFQSLTFKYYKSPAVGTENKIPGELIFLLLVCSTACNYIYSFELEDFFRFLGRGNYFYGFLLKLFKSLGIVFTGDGTRGFALVDVEDSGTGNIEEVIGRFIWEKFQRKELSVSGGLYLVLNSLNFHSPVSFIQAAVFQSYENGVLVDLRERLVSGIDSKKLEKKYCTEVINMIQGYCAVMQNDYNSAENYFAMGSDNVPEIYLGNVLLLIKNRNYSKAVEWVKKSLIACQNDKDVFGELRALFMMSRISMLQGQFSDAFDYLEYSFSCAETISDSYWKIKIRLDMAVNSFIQGNFAKTIRMAEEMLSLCRKSFFIDYELLGLFILGRVYHLTGDYGKAEEIFQKGIELAGDYRIEKGENLFKIWQGRVILYKGDYSRAEKIFLQYQEINPDSFLFLVESSVMFRNKLPPADFLNRAVGQYQQQPAWSDNSISWDSGFNFLEDRCFEGLGNIRISLRLLDAYISLLKFKNNMDIESAVKTINHVTRDSGYLEFDPNNAMYFYFYYLMTEADNEEDSVDKDTLLGRAFKCMQERVSKIDDAVIQSKYMQNSYWNSKIYAEAKENKLI